MTALAAAGYRLERGKICGVGGLRMLHLIFSSGTRRYSLFISPHFGPVETMRTTAFGAERIAAFETGHYRGLVVSERPAVECAELAHAAQKRL